MAKWYGQIGYAENTLTEPGIYEDLIVEKNAYGELIRNTRSYQMAGDINGNVNISNDISIIADPYAMNHFHNIRYVTFNGVKWIVTSVDAAQYPRLRLTLGGIWNENEN